MALLQLDELLAQTPRPAAARLEITESALNRINGMLQTRPELAGKSLRIYVTSGGCAGYSYGMAFEEANPEDHILNMDGLQVVMDPESYPWVKGIRVDYNDTLMGSGFSIINPDAQATCGCGTSFSKGDAASTDDGH